MIRINDDYTVLAAKVLAEAKKDISLTPKGPAKIDLPKPNFQGINKKSFDNLLINAKSSNLQDEMLNSFKSMLITSEDRALDSCAEKNRDNVSINDEFSVRDVFLQQDGLSLNR